MRSPSKSALFEAVKKWDAAAVKAILDAAPKLDRGQRSEGTPRAGRDALDIARARRLPKILIARLAALKGRLKS